MEHRITGTAAREQDCSTDDWVRETRFGRWFLGTDIWRKYVLAEALDKLKRMTPQQPAIAAHILDIGCGQGMALPLLDAAFAPRRITGIDIDADLIKIGRKTIAAETTAELILEQGTATKIALADDSVDMVFCHQVLHHMVQQRDALAEMYRVLRPGGLLFLAKVVVASSNRASCAPCFATRARHNAALPTTFNWCATSASSLAARRS